MDQFNAIKYHTKEFIDYPSKVIALLFFFLGTSVFAFCQLFSARLIWMAYLKKVFNEKVCQ